MNRFGRELRIEIFGESHGPAVGITVDGCPAGLPLGPRDMISDLERRLPNTPGTTKRREDSPPRILSGVFKGRTTGTPLTIILENKDTRSRDYISLKNLPRPGHADFTARRKFGGHHDFRGGGHFSGRLTAGLVAAGVIAKKLIFPVEVKAQLLEAGGRKDIDAAVDEAVREKDSVGGLVECRTTPLPVGWGEPFFDSVESLISHLMFSVPGIRGIEFGSGFESARMRGRDANDPLISADGATASNHSGGVSGGISNGNPLVFRVAVKPTSSIGREQDTIDLNTGKPARLTIEGRHDACIALRVPVIAEAAAALVLADLGRAAGSIPRVLPAD